MSRSALERFQSKYVVDEATGCWLWQAYINDRGYGTFMRGYAHRRAYELFVGPIPEGFQIHHKCRTTTCVNPDHLEALDTTAHAALRTRRTHCKYGHELTADNVYVSAKGRQCRQCSINRARE